MSTQDEEPSDDSFPRHLLFAGAFVYGALGWWIGQRGGLAWGIVGGLALAAVWCGSCAACTVGGRDG